MDFGTAHGRSRKANAEGTVMAEKDDAQLGQNAGSIPKVDLSTFILSLGTSALYQMGLVPDPLTGENAEANPLVAQQTIDTLEMLREKTLGNLDEEELKLFDSLLYELRIKFVEISR